MINMANLKAIKKYLENIQNLHKSGVTSPALVLSSLLNHYSGKTHHIGITNMIHTIQDKLKRHSKSANIRYNSESMSHEGEYQAYINKILANTPFNDKNIEELINIVDIATTAMGNTNPDDDFHAMWAAYFYTYPYIYDVSSVTIDQSILKKSIITSRLFHKKLYQTIISDVLSKEDNLFHDDDVFHLNNDLTDIVKHLSTSQARTLLDMLLSDKLLFMKKGAFQLIGEISTKLGDNERKSILQFLQNFDQHTHSKQFCFIEPYFLDQESGSAITQVIDRYFTYFIGFNTNESIKQAHKFIKALPDSYKRYFFEKLIAFINESNEQMYAGRCSAVAFFMDHTYYIPDELLPHVSDSLTNLIQYSTDEDPEHRHGLALHAIAASLKLEHNQALIDYIHKIDISFIINNWLNHNTQEELKPYQFNSLHKLLPYLSKSQLDMLDAGIDKICSDLKHNTYYDEHRKWIRNIELFSKYFTQSQSELVFGELVQALGMKNNGYNNFGAKQYLALDLIARLIYNLSGEQQNQAISIIFSNIPKYSFKKDEYSISSIIDTAIHSLEQHAIDHPDKRASICSKLLYIADNNKMISNHNRISCLGAIERINYTMEKEHLINAALKPIGKHLARNMINHN